ncbi:Aste57867_24156 [Aphanomyces stellatus]|uniref:Aste57867_24156 protein n=1 Tax=Aphanomyces stellatus TaxID=120398 RepID=A0A485LPP6_9STRA|nr:hypothetical protein As57867_024082 [Aphanomyces stellatus]VFU00798.1 Aste57867_24156 [Aphanomyces stellatus]
MQQFEPATTRYKLTPLQSSGGVQILVRVLRRPAAMVAISIFLFSWVAMGSYLANAASNSGAPIAVAAVLMVLFGASVMVSNIAVMVLGYERFTVTTTAFTHERRGLCGVTTKHYDLSLMGPLHVVVATAHRTTDEGGHTHTTTRTCFGFRYGGTVVHMGHALLPAEVEPFLSDVAPYLPPQVQPTGTTHLGLTPVATVVVPLATPVGFQVPPSGDMNKAVSTREY